MLNIGPLELMVILLVALIVVGPAKLPEIGRQIGKGLREFRKVQDEVRDSIRLNLDDEPPPRFALRDDPPKPADQEPRSNEEPAPIPKPKTVDEAPTEPSPMRGAPDDGAAPLDQDHGAPE
jgi:TatA/E family protein of Tat protein translocase